MGSIEEIMQLCRLCLVKDQVNVPIFDEQGDVKQIFPKIKACLPVKVCLSNGRHVCLMECISNVIAC